MNITIRKALSADISCLSSLFNLYRQFYEKEPDIEAARIFMLERIQLGDSVIFVAEHTDGTLAGFTQLYPLFSSTRMQRLWLLNDLYVSENFRGRGISKALIEAAKALARETDACGLLLETAKTNGIGNRLYHATGFEIADESNFYFWTTK